MAFFSLSKGPDLSKLDYKSKGIFKLKKDPNPLGGGGGGKTLKLHLKILPAPPKIGRAPPQRFIFSIWKY